MHYIALVSKYKPRTVVCIAIVLYVPGVFLIAFVQIAVLEHFVMTDGKCAE